MDKTSAVQDKQSSAMETKQNIGGAKPKWKTPTGSSQAKTLACAIYCTIVRWYNGTYQRKAEAPPAKVVQLNINGRQKTIVQQQLSLRGKKNDCMTATINGRQRRLRLCSPNAPVPMHHHHHFLCRESIVKCLKSYCCPWCFLILNAF